MVRRPWLERLDFEGRNTHHLGIQVLHPVDERRLFRTNDRHFDLGRNEGPSPVAFGSTDSTPRMDPRSSHHGRQKPQLVGAVVGTATLVLDLEQRKGQEAMRHRAAERAFRRRSYDIDMDPLMVAGEISETVDQLLSDLNLGAPEPEILGGQGI